jgi:hypothetical protein
MIGAQMKICACGLHQHVQQLVSSTEQLRSRC